MEVHQVSFEQVVNLAQHLSAIEKLRLIEHLSSDLEKALLASSSTRRRSLRGLLKDCHITDADIDEARQEMWGNLGQEDI